MVGVAPYQVEPYLIFTFLNPAARFSAQTCRNCLLEPLYTLTKVFNVVPFFPRSELIFRECVSAS